MRYIQALVFGVVILALQISSSYAYPASSPEIQVRRGKDLTGSGADKPILNLHKPDSGWTSSMMIDVEGSCSDASADPVIVNINGLRYYIRTQNGSFERKFPASKGKNNVIVECANKGGVTRISRSLEAVINPIPLKVVLTSDTDGVYTDLHIYEPDGTHVYWAETHSPTGGLFFLNKQGDSFDQPGYGPYLYVHPAPVPGVYRIDANYWPGGAVQHTLATLQVVIKEGLADETRKTVNKPLARPGETSTLAYVVIRPNSQSPSVWVPGQDPESSMPKEIKDYKAKGEPKKTGEDQMDASDETAFLTPSDEKSARQSVVALALQQAKKLSNAWEPAQRDCAGLVRFAYKETLHPRSLEWAKNVGLPKSLYLPALSKKVFNVVREYPKMWHTSFLPESGYTNSAFADGETLLGYNFRLKSRNVADVSPGDVLAFKKEDEEKEPYHLMIYAGVEGGHLVLSDADRDSEGIRDRGLVVYHTGERSSLGLSTPTVRVVSLKELFHSPDPTWIPSESNGHFLGVYEWTNFKQRRKVV